MGKGFPQFRVPIVARLIPDYIPDSVMTEQMSMIICVFGYPCIWWKSSRVVDN